MATYSCFLGVFTNSLDLMQIWGKNKLKKPLDKLIHSFFQLFSGHYVWLYPVCPCMPTWYCTLYTVHSFIIWRILINDVWSWNAGGRDDRVNSLNPASAGGGQDGESLVTSCLLKCYAPPPPISQTSV